MSTIWFTLPDNSYPNLPALLRGDDPDLEDEDEEIEEEDDEDDDDQEDDNANNSDGYSE